MVLACEVEDMLLYDPEGALGNTAKRNGGTCALGHIYKNVIWGIFVITPNEKQTKCPLMVKGISEL